MINRTINPSGLAEIKAYDSVSDAGLDVEVIEE